MSITVSDIYNFIDQIAPFSTQESWDNSGLLVGDGKTEVKKVMVCLDATNKCIDEAVKTGADLIVTHHPVIWEPLKFVPGDIPVSRAIRNGICIVCAHTNWDIAAGGVNDVLSRLIGLENISQISPEGELSMLRVGELKTPVPAEDFAEIVSTALDTVVRLALPKKMIKTVAVCGGSGASFLPDLTGHNIDAFVTGDAKHNDFLDASDLDITLMAAGHYETETISMPVMMNLLKKEFPEVEFTYFEDAPVVYIG